LSHLIFCLKTLHLLVPPLRLLRDLVTLQLLLWLWPLFQLFWLIIGLGAWLVRLASFWLRVLVLSKYVISHFSLQE